MRIDNQHYRTIWVDAKDPGIIRIIDQRNLPHEFVIEELTALEDFVRAIRDMHVRGAPLIGGTAAYGLYVATREAPAGPGFEAYLEQAMEQLKNTRPTAVDLFNALTRVRQAIEDGKNKEEKVALAFNAANELVDESAEHCRLIGQHGLSIIQDLAARKDGGPVNILTHCNAGWMACIDYGTATSPGLCCPRCRDRCSRMGG